MAIVYNHRRRRAPEAQAAGRFAWVKYVPLFVVAFVLLAAVRSIGDLGGAESPAFGFVDRQLWEAFLAGAKSLSVWCLTVAMAAIGLGTSIKQLVIDHLCEVVSAAGSGGS
jgi:uncharacterized membrane protein YadS